MATVHMRCGYLPTLIRASSRPSSKEITETVSLLRELTKQNRPSRLVMAQLGSRPTGTEARRSSSGTESNATYLHFLWLGGGAVSNCATGAFLPEGGAYLGR